MASEMSTVYVIRHNKTRVMFTFLEPMRADNKRAVAQQLLTNIRDGMFDDWTYLDGSMMLSLAEWAQRIVTFRSGAVELLQGVSPVFRAHMFLGMSIFLVFPFTRLVHVWSGFGTLAYLVRPYQVVRSRRLNVPAGHNLPRQPDARV